MTPKKTIKKQTATKPAEETGSELSKLTPAKFAKAVDELTTWCGLEDEDWTWLLVGDGSGNRYGYPIGAACVGVRNGMPEPFVWTMSCSNGTNNIAETMAYQLPLNEIVQRADADPCLSTWCKIHIVTDSEYAQKASRKRGGGGAHALLWDSMLRGLPPWITVRFHWRERGHPLNRVADDLSRRARLSHYRH